MPGLARHLTLAAYVGTVSVAAAVAVLDFRLHPMLVVPVAAAYAMAGVAWWERPGVVAEVRRRRGQCVRCGYDLTGNTSGTCPECGTAAATGGAKE